MAAQKTLIQQLQEADAEARELQDFMQVSANLEIAFKGIVRRVLNCFPYKTHKTQLTLNFKPN